MDSPLPAVRRAFEDLVSENRDSASAERPEYRWDALGFAAESGTILLRLTFLKGRSYCCYETGCHLSLGAASDWNRLRQSLTRNGLVLPGTPLILQLQVVVEAGAKFHGYPPAYGATAAALTFAETLREPASDEGPRIRER